MPELPPDPEPGAYEPDPGGVPRETRAGEPFWRRPEFGWPLALLAGFGGTWIGLKTGIPGAAALLPVALFAPLYVPPLRADRRIQAALMSSFWVLAIAGAVVGDALEGNDVLAIVPGGQELVRSELGFLEGSSASPLATLPRNLFVFLLIGALGRPLWGLGALLGSSLVAGGLAACASTWAVEAVERGWKPSLAALAGLPPHLFLGLLAIQLGAAALAGPAETLSELRRALLWSAVGLGGIALGLQGPWVQAWRGWLGG